MVTTRENDWQPHVNGVPWMQKARPGLRPARESRGVRFAAAPPPAPVKSPHPAIIETAMPTSARKQRLLREAHETEDGDIAGSENDFVMVAIAVLMLSIYWGAAAIALASAMNRGGDAVYQSFATQKNEQPAIGAVLPAGTRNRAANFTNYQNSGSR